ncbi:MAG: hypothetical protein JNL42_20750 [Anaerolineae bacterium]|nr:hypothetical protein [Anaerolineae bacterium]
MNQPLLLLLIVLLALLVTAFAYLMSRQRPARSRPAQTRPGFAPVRREPDTEDFAAARLPDDLSAVSVLLYIHYFQPDREFVGWVAVLPDRPPADYFPPGMGYDVAAWQRDAYWLRVVVAYEQEQSQSLANGYFEQAVGALDAAGWHSTARHYDQPQRRFYRLER